MVQQDFEQGYERAVVLLTAFGEYIETLLKALLAEDGMRIHAVTHRVKSRESTERKLARPRKGMNDAGPRTLDALTDLLGIRIITYLGNEVDIVARVIEREFTIDRDNTVDKRALLDTDQFGYLSMHYIAELSPSRIALPEYQKYAGIKFEIQIRSLLQHAWAEIEHDLGYKSEAAVPRRLRRRLSRLASHLEFADDEFVDIRDEIGHYQDQAQGTIDSGVLGIEINQDSLAAFVQSSDRVTRFDGLIARARHATVQDHIDPQFLGQQAGRLSALGFHYVGDLSGYLDKNAELLARFIEHWLALAYSGERVGRQGRVAPAVPIGITLYYGGALRYAQDPGDGKVAGHGDWAYSSNLLRQALRAALSDGNSSAPSC